MSCLIKAVEGCGKKCFWIMTTVIPVDPRFFWAPKKMAEKLDIGIFLERILELISATTIGLSGPGSRHLGNPGNSTPDSLIVAVINHGSIVR